MSVNAEQFAFSTQDKAKLWIAVILAIAGIIGFYWLEDRQSIWLRSAVILAGFAVAALVIMFSAYGGFLREFFVESQFELRKIVWPTRQETIQTTLVIFIVVLVVSLMLFAFDSVLGMFFRWLFSTGQGASSS